MTDSVNHAPYKLQPKVRVESPIGSIEVDSGSHGLDSISVVLIVLLLYIGKKAIDKFFRKIS